MNPEDYIGRHLLAGITWLDADDNVVRRTELHGVIVRVNDEEGIVVRHNRTGEEFSLPPYSGALQPAEPGDYQLQSSSEVVHDPDYLAVWTMYEHP